MEDYEYKAPDVRIKPASRKKSRLQPIRPDALRRTSTGFGAGDQTRALQILMEENDQLKKDLEEARKEIFKLKEENLLLKKNSRGGAQKGHSTFVTSSNPEGASRVSENSKVNNDEKVCNNCGNSIAINNYSLHVIYCEKNLTECSY